ncbi:MAG: hypothetical protein JNM27_00250 [Leptospirales bacterium]|nr:hypothetical protein [Leptospirales bacterium]
MKQSAGTVPEHSHQRKAAIARGGIADHALLTHVRPIQNFDLNRTIFNTLEGSLPRLVIQTRIAKDVSWDAEAARSIEQEYRAKSQSKKLPPIDEKLLRFLTEECDFDVEHADGSFLDHLYYCYEYTHHYFPGHSALVMLLHSILGTGTNTFAMGKEKIPRLKPLMSPDEWNHVQAFPSVLRLLYDNALFVELQENAARRDSLKEVHFHRVIDNEPIMMSGKDFWIQLNYQLIHLTDFIPVSNWSAHYADSSFILFRKLYKFLQDTGKLEAKINYTAPPFFARVKGEQLPLAGWLLTLLPSGISEAMTAKSVRKFSERIGHDLSYKLVF